MNLPTPLILNVLSKAILLSLSLGITACGTQDITDDLPDTVKIDITKPDANTDTVAGSDANSNSNTDSSSDSNSSSSSSSSSDTNSNTDTVAGSDANANANANVNSNSNTDTDTNSNSNSNSNTDTDSNTDTNTNTNSNTDSNTDTDTDTNTDTDTDTDTNTNTDSNTDSNTDTNSNTDTDTGSSGSSSSTDSNTDSSSNSNSSIDTGENTNLVKPTTPTLSWLTDSMALNNGSVDINVAWNMWWGENGNHWEMYLNGKLATQQTLLANTPNAQSAATLVSIDKTGDYTIEVRLCNSKATEKVCSSAQKQFVVTAANPSATGTEAGTEVETETSSNTDELNLSAWPKPLKELNKAYTNTSKKVVASYFVEWGVYGRDYHVADIPAQNLTHLIYGFVPICGPNDSLKQDNPQGYSALVAQCAGKEDYTVVIHDKYAALEKSYPEDKWDDPMKGNFGQLKRLKASNPHLKIIPSIGGWTLSDPFFYLANDPSHRASFVKSALNFIKTYDFFDGIDIDWEFPGGKGANTNLGSASDFDAYAVLMHELRVALDLLSAETGRSYLLTSAVGTGPDKIAAANYADAEQYMDLIFAMTYDYYGAWNGQLGHHAGLYQATHGLETGFNAHDAINNLMNAGVPANKLVLGAAMYGRGWQGISNATQDNPWLGEGSAQAKIKGTWEDGVLDYRDIVDNFQGGSNGTGINAYTYYYDEIAQAPYLWNSSTGSLVTYDNPRSSKAKGQYVLDNGLAGIFAWEIDADNGEILNAINEGLGHPQK